jgi:cysteinyl-tRNA synthetase
MKGNIDIKGCFHTSKKLLYFISGDVLLLKFYNSLTKRIEPFISRNKRKVKMFSCGPSVYRKPHIGNYRTFLFEDIFQRYLEYLDYDVIRIISVTDIEDKGISEAKEKQISLEELTEGNINLFFEDACLLKIKAKKYVSRASETVEQAVTLIKALLNKGYAYRYKYDGAKNIYFDPLKFRNFGKLSGININEWPKKKRRFHRDNYPGTPWNKGDFILWCGYREGDEVFWNTEMIITKNIDFEIDVACGGIDNLVRHHDYNIAILEGVSKKVFARYWLHCEHLFVEGKKMSKSIGNVYYPKDLVKKGYTGKHIRFFLIYKHYRKRSNFNFKKFEKASKRLDIFRSKINDLKKTKSNTSNKETKELINDILSSFERNMNNDLNLKAAFDELFETLLKLDKFRKQGKLSFVDADVTLNNLRKIDSVLKIIF